MAVCWREQTREGIITQRACKDGDGVAEDVEDVEARAAEQCGAHLREHDDEHDLDVAEHRGCEGRRRLDEQKRRHVEGERERGAGKDVKPHAHLRRRATHNHRRCRATRAEGRRARRQSDAGNRAVC
eukprot:5202873-Prymnesium_polylepis.3